MITQKEIEQAVKEKLMLEKLPEGLIIDSVKPVGDDSVVCRVTVAGSWIPPQGQMATKDKEGKISLKPVPEWLLPYIW
jgi:hypothetical protein